MKTISIIGLGWLGLPLANFLSQLNFSIKGTVSSAEKLSQFQSSKFLVRQLKFNPHPEGKDFNTIFETDILIINIPPKTHVLGADFHPEQIKYIKMLAQQAHVKKIIFISSSSIYLSSSQWARESDIITSSDTGNLSLFRAEQILKKDASYDLSIIRFGGLMGQQRIPGKYFSNKSQVVGDAPVNYIHQMDAIRMIHWIMEKELWNEVFNGVAPLHPNRAQVYEKNAAEFNFSPPLSYAPEGTELFKIISADKILATGFSFQFANPLDFTYLPST